MEALSGLISKCFDFWPFMSLIKFSAQLVFDFYTTCPAGFYGTKISVLKGKKDLKGRSKKHQRPIGWKKLMRDLNSQGSKHEGL